MVDTSALERFDPLNVRLFKSLGRLKTNLYDSSGFDGDSLKAKRDYLQAYYDFKETVDFTQGGFLPDLDNLVWYLLVGVPPVPADEDPSETGQMAAVDQRVNILKAIFVELNKSMPDCFLDEGLGIYDRAVRSVRTMLEENGEEERDA